MRNVLILFVILMLFVTAVHTVLVRRDTAQASERGSVLDHICGDRDRGCRSEVRGKRGSRE